MTILEKIQPFCSTDETRLSINNPFVSDGYFYATDGRAVVRFKTDQPEAPPEENKRFPHSVGKIFKDNIAEFMRCGGAIWFPLPTILPEPKDTTRICPKCAGHGTVFHLSEGKKHEDECAFCNGDGELDKTEIAKQAMAAQSQGSRPVFFNVTLLHRVASLAPVNVAVLREEFPLWFKTTDGQFEGFVMPIRRE